jgi:hypothetical protein
MKPAPLSRSTRAPCGAPARRQRLFRRACSTAGRLATSAELLITTRQAPPCSRRKPYRIVKVAKRSGAISQFCDTFLTRAVITAKHSAPALQTMPDDAYTAMRARGRKCMNCAFKAIKGIGLTLGDHLKRFVVLIYRIHHIWPSASPC